MKCSPPQILLPAACLLLSLAACSVKEDRGGCPCELTVTGTGPLPSGGDVLVSVIQDGRVVRQGMMGSEEFESVGCTLTVPRAPSLVTVFTGITDMNERRGSTLAIQKGNDCDRIYSTSEAAEPDGDAFTCAVTPHKNYALLELIMPGVSGSDPLRVEGKIAGYNLLSAAPSDGAFGFDPPAEGEHWLVRLPRQKDESLTLSVTLSGGQQKTVPLGSLIAMTGYDFEAEDLADITMTIDIAREVFTVQIGAWEDGGSKEINFGTQSQ